MHSEKLPTEPITGYWLLTPHMTNYSPSELMTVNAARLLRDGDVVQVADAVFIYHES